jgi:hypothetical protein
MKTYNRIRNGYRALSKEQKSLVMEKSTTLYKKLVTAKNRRGVNNK